MRRLSFMQVNLLRFLKVFILIALNSLVTTTIQQEAKIVENSSNQIAMLEAEIKAVKKEIDYLESWSKGARQARKDAKTREEAISSFFIKEIEVNKLNITNLESQLAAAGELEAPNSQIVKLENQLVIEKEKLAELKVVVEDLKQLGVSPYEKAMAALEVDVEIVKKEVEELEVWCEEASQALEDAKAQKDKVISPAESENTTSSQGEEVFAFLLKQTEINNSRITSLEDQLATAKADATNLKAFPDGNTKELAVANSQIVKLENQLFTVKEKLAEVESVADEEIVYSLIVEFEGGNVYDNFSKVLKLLHNSNYDWDTYEISAKGGYCTALFDNDVFNDITKEFPCTANIRDLLKIWNDPSPLPTSEELLAEDTFKVPKLKIEKSSFFHSFTTIGISLEEAQKKYDDLEELVNNWSGKIIDDCNTPLTRESIENCAIIRAKFPNYKITFEFDNKKEFFLRNDDLKQLRNSNRELRSNVQIYFPDHLAFLYKEIENYTPQPLFSMISFGLPKKVTDSCSRSPQGGIRSKFAQGAMWSYLNSSSISECIDRCITGDCPEVVLIDEPVFHHPDIIEALGLSQSGSGVAESGNGNCKKVSDDELEGLSDEKLRSFHGTHLAGIIASANNEVGFVGMSPKARISSYDIAEAPVDKIHQIIQEFVYPYASGLKQPFPIFVYASRMGGYLDDYLEDNGLLTGKEYRETHNMARAIIADVTDQFWVVALGEHRETDTDFPSSTVIESLTPMAPQNLAEEQNVLLVGGCTNCSTDCTNCSTSPIELYPDVFTAEKNYVHVVAPAENIVSLLDESSHGSLSGTSQATAFVGGLSAAMLTCHREKYQVPSQLKEMILVTSKPFKKSPDQEYVATGVIDPLLALKDPKYVWLKKDSSYEPVLVSRWCIRDINYSSVSANSVLPSEQIVITKDLRRIFTQESNQHFLYVKPSSHMDRLGFLESIGPVTIDNAYSEPVLALIVECKLGHFEECREAAKNGEGVKQIKLNEFKDLVFGSQVPYFDIPKIPKAPDSYSKAQRVCEDLFLSNGS